MLPRCNCDESATRQSVAQNDNKKPSAASAEGV